MAATVEGARAELADLIGRPAHSADFGGIVSAAVRGVMPFDGWCLFGLDPRTRLRTFQLGGRGTEHTAELSLNEAVQHDVNKFTELARSSSPAGVLSRDHPLANESLRFNEILRPQGFHSEMRLALCDGGRLWGALVLFRDDLRDFNRADIDLVQRLAPTLASVVRRYPTRPFASPPAGLCQGIVLIGPDNRLLAVSCEAQAWLDDLVPGGDDETNPTNVTRVLFDAANAVRATHDDLPTAATTTIRTVSGRWLAVQGNRLRYGEADVAVLLQAATVRQLIPIITDIHGLSQGEATVLQGIATGLATKHIARTLHLSPHTVNGHLKSIYRKTKVSGKGELLGQLR